MIRYPHALVSDDSLVLRCRCGLVLEAHGVQSSEYGADCPAALRARVEELEAHVGSIDAGIEALLRDCRAHLALALRAAEAEAYPGHGWRRAVRDTVSVLDGVLGVERVEHREGG